MPDLGFELEEISRLIKLVEQRGLSELVVEEADRQIVIRGLGYRRSRTVVATTAHSVESGSVVHEHAPALVEHQPPAEERLAVLSPMVGVYYRSPTPDSASFVEVGDHVEVGQTIGIIEAMKVFSEVPCDHTGTVAEVPVENGQLVKPNDPLLYLIPD